MHEPFIDTSGPSLGGLKVYTKPAPSASSNNDLAYHQPKMTPVWRLYNQQAPVWKYAQAKFMETEPVQVSNVQIFTIIQLFNALCLH